MKREPKTVGRPRRGVEVAQHVVSSRVCEDVLVGLDALAAAAGKTRSAVIEETLAAAVQVATQNNCQTKGRLMKTIEKQLSHYQKLLASPVFGEELPIEITATQNNCQTK